jgi:hypothetical protein
MLVIMYILYCANIVKQQTIRILNVKPQWRYFFLYDVSYSVYLLLCKYCEATNNKNPKCQTLMKVRHLWVMLVVVYILWCADITKQQKITFMNVTRWWGYCFFCMTLVIVYILYVQVLQSNRRLESWMSNYNENIIFLSNVNFSLRTLLCQYCEATKDYNPKP